MTKQTKKHPEIPVGSYCYKVVGPIGENGFPKTKVCPYWSIDPDKPEQSNGYCSFLKSGDWEDIGLGLLWDQVKACDENTYDWYDTLLEAISRMSKLPKGWYGGDEEPFTTEIIATANKIAEALFKKGISEISGYPTRQETIVFEWFPSGFDCYLEFGAETATFLIRKDNAMVRGENGTIEDVLTNIDEHES